MLSEQALETQRLPRLCLCSQEVLVTSSSLASTTHTPRTTWEDALCGATATDPCSEWLCPRRTRKYPKQLAHEEEYASKAIQSWAGTQSHCGPRTNAGKAQPTECWGMKRSLYGPRLEWGHFSLLVVSQCYPSFSKGLKDNLLALSCQRRSLFNEKQAQRRMFLAGRCSGKFHGSSACHTTCQEW